MPVKFTVLRDSQPCSPGEDLTKIEGDDEEVMSIALFVGWVKIIHDKYSKEVRETSRK